MRSVKGCCNLFLIRWHILVYMAFIFVATCTSDPHAFLYRQVISFKIDSSPVFIDMFIIGDIPWTSGFYWIQKTAHVLGFGLLYILLLRGFNNMKFAFVISGSYAFITEVLQLYFYRSGRLVDVGIDLVGIYLSYLLYESFSEDAILP
ncbi:VanZ family protein [Sporosarcina jiandibaonis]|uniref:VanZ family protein n=1 Tax=Sporosarcina jiandibaonis TaxID=2715535 RepID=UPI00155794F9|nr:VanZ family protein [Sporosarcina jiandibaonis]